MRTAAVLAGCLLLLVVVLPAFVADRPWTRRAPRLAIAVWAVLSGTALLAVVLAAAAAAMPLAWMNGGVRRVLTLCVARLRVTYGETGVVVAELAAVVVVALVVAAGGAVARELVVAGRRARRHLARLDLVGRRDADLQAVVLDHPTPTAYCVPGRHHRVVVSAGALASLSATELRAVLAHEHAHLSGRHHVLLAVSRGLGSVLPFVPLYRAAAREVSLLVELAADDAAVRHTCRGSLASALLALSCGTAPAAALAAGGPGALARVRRLLVPAAPRSRVRRWLAAAGGAALVVLPVALAVAPAALAVFAMRCPFLVPA